MNAIGKYIIALILILSASEAFAQLQTPASLMKLKPVGIGRQPVDTAVAIYLPMPFSKSNFISTYQMDKIPSADRIYAIHLVYTRYREVDSFNQPRLNLYRFEELKKNFPDLFSLDVEWQVLEQRDAKTKEAASKCFHGFVIYLKTLPPKVLLDRDLTFISTAISTYKDTLIWVPEKIEYKIKKRKVETGYYLPNNKKKKHEGTRYHSSGIWLREPEYKVYFDSSVKKKSGGYWQHIGEFDTSAFPGTFVFNTLTKRKWSPKTAIVTDVTGSMGPYSTQILLWLRFSPEMLQQGRFTFFNDGDGTPDMLKKLGRTGGIYFAHEANFDSVRSVMESTMRKGLGGDLPENDLEAVIATLKKWPDTDTVLLIADNQAHVKDLALLDQIHTPVSVMVCGMYDRIHPDYIEIVKRTGGRMYVLDREISSFKNISPGARERIGNKWYQWKKGTFVMVN